ncbi:MAG: tetratricopeptide repeat protein [Acetobacteraceae bacterium]
MADAAAIARLQALFVSGALADAQALAQALLEQDPANAEAWHVLGLAAYRGGRVEEALTLLRRSLALAASAPAWSNLGAVLRAAGRPADAEAAYRQALGLQPDLLDCLGNLANLLVAERRHEAAQAVLARAVLHHPGDPDLRQRLAAAGAAVAQDRQDGAAVVGQATKLHFGGDHAGAAATLRGRLAARPDDAAAWECLGSVLAACGQWHEADQALVRCLDLAPGVAAAHVVHSDVQRQLGRMAAAEASARRALALVPGLVTAAVNLGNALVGQRRHTEAETAFDLALAGQEDCAEALNGRGVARLRRAATVAAETDFRRLLRLRPDLASVGSNLGIALLDQGRPVEALAVMDAACAECPDTPTVWRNRLFCLNYHPDLPAGTIAAAYRAWGGRQQPAPPAGRQRQAGGRLRIGYVSPDFRGQSASFFIRPLLAAHDRREVELYCYAELPHQDAATDAFRALADHWRPTVELDDAGLAGLIGQDRIDVLVDMGGYSTNSRIMAFARRPAPVQVEYLLGHGTTSGLPAMDVFLADRHLAPPGCDDLFAERVVRLDRIPLAYQPPADLPPVAPLPAAACRQVTFGYFGRTPRLHAGVVAAWARILLAVPSSRLVLNNAPFGEPALQASFRERFARHGVEPHRLDLIYTRPQPQTFAAYGGVDIALDPFPHNAGTTTIEALWMGVPVVSLTGRPPVGRFGASILNAVGLQDWCTDDLDAYVARAVSAAADLGGLAALRGSLRARCEASPLHDAPGLTRSLESLYRTLAG